MSSIPPEEASAWLARQEGFADQAECLRRVRQAIRDLVLRYGEHVCRRCFADDAPSLDDYARRLWRCLEYHWRQQAADRPIRLSDLLPRLENRAVPTRGNLLLDVTLAEALEQREEAAAALFEAQYMPVVRATARRLGGNRAAEHFENFAADLILPREQRPPRIALFQGRTPLSAWLRAVVTNTWMSEMRRKKSLSIEDRPQLQIAAAEAAPDVGPCQQLLRPLFYEAVAALEAEERLILKLLLLHGVPQQSLARSFGVNSGTLTRRRQRAAENVLRNIQQLSAKTDDTQQTAECLELLLTEGHAELKASLATLLAAAMDGTTEAVPHRESAMSKGG